MLSFVWIELGIANTMLDGAAASRDQTGRLRRRALAMQACDEVVRYLATDVAQSGLSLADREELSAALVAVRARLALD